MVRVTHEPSATRPITRGLIALSLTLGLLTPIAALAETPPRTTSIRATDLTPAPTPVPASISMDERDDLVGLLTLPDRSLDRAGRTDKALRDAVAEGSRPDLEAPNPFRKRNFDFFRARRDVEIGRREVQVRLRLRAKTKDTVSVQLRF